MGQILAFSEKFPPVAKLQSCVLTAILSRHYSAGPYVCATGRLPQMPRVLLKGFGGGE